MRAQVFIDLLSALSANGGCYDPAVDQDSFWRLLAEYRQHSNNNADLMPRILFRHLRTLQATDVVAFVQHWERARSRLYSWPVADAACLLLGPIADEDLRFIQDWIISFGRPTVERIARNPDDLVDLSRDAGTARAPWFDEFVTEAHILVVGTWPPGYDPDGPDELTGVHQDVADRAVAERHFPRLAAFRRDHPELGVPELQ